VGKRKRYLLLSAVLGAAFVVVPAIAESSPTVNGTESLTWSPHEVTVRPGGAVTFQNTSTTISHGVVWEPGDPSTPACSGVPVNKGETNWKGSCSFSNAGTYRYYCFVHGRAMSGIVSVGSSPPPTITSLSPKRGAHTGGTSVTIAGMNFSGATAVRFGSTNAAKFNVNSATSITAATPEEVPGRVDVTVTTPEGTSALSHKDRFTFKKSKK
jgi:plastocyanin